MTTARDLEQPATFTSITRLHTIATQLRDVADHTHPAVLTPAIRDEMRHFARAIDLIATNTIEVERVVRGGA